MIVAVDPYLIDWLNLLSAGRTLPPASPDRQLLLLHRPRPALAPARSEGHRGRRCGRGVGDPRRRLLSGPEVPRRAAHAAEPLHWFKWEAYLTWLSGFALFASSTTSRPTSTSSIRADMSAGGHWPQPRAAGTGLAGVRPAVATAGVGIAARRGIRDRDRDCRLRHRASSRPRRVPARGRLLGTIMVANVFFVIIPGQRALVAAKQAGRVPEARASAASNARSTTTT